MGPNELCVINDFLKSKASADLFEVLIVGVRHRFDQTHKTATADVNHRVAGDQRLLKPAQCDDWLNCRTGFKSG
jgi:hypothetical protein